ncbi:MAG: hypothetical protein AAF517_02490 [Planctomycetota bacterium]
MNEVSSSERFRSLLVLFAECSLEPQSYNAQSALNLVQQASDQILRTEDQLATLANDGERALWMRGALSTIAARTAPKLALGALPTTPPLPLSVAFEQIWIRLEAWRQELEGDAEWSTRLVDALGELAAEDRRALRLIQLMGYSLPKAAEAMNDTAGMVAGRLENAQQSVRARLSSDE